MRRAFISALLVFSLISACGKPDEKIDAHAIVVGAGISGLSAAVELARGGAKVIVLDMNSVGGGHAVMAGGVALVGTPLQEARGIADAPDIAVADWMAWGETNDPDWTRLYAEKSREDVYDWVSAMGVEFVTLIPTPENSVPRFHFTKGKAAHLVLPLFREALKHPNIAFLWNTEATRLILDDAGVAGVETKNLRTGETHSLLASAVILATGGFQSNLDMVRANWTPDTPFPERLLIGAGAFATGSGFVLATNAGAMLDRITSQVTFIGGIPNPRNPERALVVSNRQAIWVNDKGQRFTNEAASDKINASRILALQPAHYWMIFDQTGVNRLTVRDALWLSRDAITAEIISNSDITASALTLDELSAKTGLPAQNLANAIARYNDFAETGLDEDFARFQPGARRKPVKIAAPPFYAIKLYPVTRKNLGGVAIDFSGRALNKDRQPIHGLYAAGELTGLAGINGDFGMAGTFLGPSILTGRLAAQGALADLPSPRAPVDPNIPQAQFTASELTPGLKDLPGLIAADRPGYWHFETSHSLVLERKYPCAMCHVASAPKAPAQTSAAMLKRMETCLTCH